MAAIEHQLAALRDVVEAGHRQSHEAQRENREALHNILALQLRQGSELAKLDEVCKVLQAENELMQAENVLLKERMAALEQGCSPDSTCTLEVKWVMEGSADFQHQREQLGVIALLLPNQHLGLPEIASMLDVDPGRLSWASSRERGVMLLHLANPQDAQRWLNHFKACNMECCSPSTFLILGMGNPSHGFAQLSAVLALPPNLSPRGQRAFSKYYFYNYPGELLASLLGMALIR